MESILTARENNITILKTSCSVNILKVGGRPRSFFWTFGFTCECKGSTHAKMLTIYQSWAFFTTYKVKPILRKVFYGR